MTFLSTSSILLLLLLSNKESFGFHFKTAKTASSLYHNTRLASHQEGPAATHTNQHLPAITVSSSEEETLLPTSSRRNLFKSIAISTVAILSTANAVHPQKALADDDDDEAINKPLFAKTPKILVLGGTGLVGSQVVRQLQSLNIPYIATSRNGRDGTEALEFAASNSSLESDVARLAKGCTAVISCVGAIGSANDAAINAGNGIAAKAAKAAGVSHFVYVSIAPEVVRFANSVNILQEYMSGKQFARSAVMNIFDEQQYTLIEPTFIYGGNEFKLNPPRVNDTYGKLVESVLSSGLFRGLVNVAPEGFIKIALEPPISAADVAGAAIAGALGKSDDAILDTYDEIKAAAALV